MLQKSLIVSCELKALPKPFQTTAGGTELRHWPNNQRLRRNGRRWILHGRDRRSPRLSSIEFPDGGTRTVQRGADVPDRGRLDGKGSAW
jgi:hypothetical protein